LGQNPLLRERENTFTFSWLLMVCYYLHVSLNETLRIKRSCIPLNSPFTDGSRLDSVLIVKANAVAWMVIIFLLNWTWPFQLLIKQNSIFSSDDQQKNWIFSPQKSDTVFLCRLYLILWRIGSSKAISQRS
jgi:hypothetical protein